MADGIELNSGQTEIAEVPENEQVVIKVESRPKLVYHWMEETSGLPPGLDICKVYCETSRRQLTDFVWKSQLVPEEPENEQVVNKVKYAILKSLSRDRDGLRKDTKLSEQKSKGTWSDQSLALLITVMGLFAGAAYMVLFSFQDAFPLSAPFKGVNLSIWELLTFPRAATEDFLVITTVTTTFILSMGTNTVALCIFFRNSLRGTFLTILALFTVAAFSLSFFAMLSKFIPHHITIAGGKLKIPATFIVIFYDIYVTILVCAFAYTVHWCWSSRRNQDAVVERKSVV